MLVRAVVLRPGAAGGWEVRLVAGEVQVGVTPRVDDRGLGAD